MRPGRAGIRRGLRTCSAIALAVAVGALLAGSARATLTTIYPLVDCVSWDAQNNALTIQFGYVSGESTAVQIPIGNDNSFSPGIPNRGQPRIFDPGVHHDVFTVLIALDSASQISWTLDSSVSFDAATVTATNDPSAYCADAQPITNATAPSVLGSATVGSTLSADSGTWAGAPAPVLTYQWQRDDGAGGWADIAGATSVAYAPVTDDVGHTLRIEVTGTNVHTASPPTAASAATAAVALPSASNSAAPSVSGTAVVGSTLSVDPGSWSGAGSVSLAYQWQRDDGAGGWADVAGASDVSYSPVSGDVGHALRVQVSGSTLGGPALSVPSAATGAVALASVSNSVAPSVSGTAAVGSTLSVDPGSWSGAGSVSLAYQWQRDDGSGGWADVAGATGVAYVPVASDVGHTLRIEVTGTSVDATPLTVASAATALVAAPPATNAGGGGSGGGSASVATSAPQLGTAAGTGAGSTATPNGVRISWPAGTFAGPVTVAARSVGVAAAAGGFAAGGRTVELTVTGADGFPITDFAQPLTFHFPAEPAGTMPGYSHDGSAWTPIPRLETPTLPAGQPDGYYTEPDGTIEVLTRHATLFGFVADRQAPSRPALPVGQLAGGRLRLRWGVALDNSGAVAGYTILRSGKPVATVTGTTVSVDLRPGAFTVVARDATGNQSSPSIAVLVVARARPRGLPRAVPSWARRLLAWQHGGGERGARPRGAPAGLPTWYWVWRSWKLEPFRVSIR